MSSSLFTVIKNSVKTLAMALVVMAMVEAEVWTLSPNSHMNQVLDSALSIFKNQLPFILSFGTIFVRIDPISLS